MLSKLRKRQKGFTLIELLIVVAIIGIIAAILIPNFLDALQKGRMKRTMGDLRQIGLALGQMYVDTNGAAAAGQQTIDVGDWDGTGSTTDVADLEDSLIPDYTTSVPTTDAWNNDLDLHVTLVNPPRAGWALIRSQNADDAFEGDTYTSGQFDPTDYDSDCVWADGAFARAPRSAMTAGT